MILGNFANRGLGVWICGWHCVYRTLSGAYRTYGYSANWLAPPRLENVGLRSKCRLFCSFTYQQDFGIEKDLIEIIPNTDMGSTVNTSALAAGTLFNVGGLVALITGGGTGQYLVAYLRAHPSRDSLRS